MRTLIPAILFVTASIALAAPADRGPGLAARPDGNGYSFAATGFDRIALGGAETVEVRTGAAFAVHATGSAAAFARLRVVSENGSLKIERRYRDQDRSEADRRADAALERQVGFTVSMPALREVSLGGSGRVAVDRVSGGTLAANLGGSGTIAFRTLGVDRFKVAIGGSGVVSAAGRAGDLDVSIGGSGRFVAADLRAASAKVSTAGSGSVQAAVIGTAQISAVGSGSVDLGAAARCQVTRMGSARVRCGG